VLLALQASHGHGRTPSPAVGRVGEGAQTQMAPLSASWEPSEPGAAHPLPSWFDRLTMRATID